MQNKEVYCRSSISVSEAESKEGPAIHDKKKKKKQSQCGCNGHVNLLFPVSRAVLAAALLKHMGNAV
ncbi:MAG: hypothetical protein R6X34_13130 [Chloroflexota bacterium]